MVERNANWATLDDDEKVQWLTEYVGVSSPNNILDANFIHACIASLRGNIKKQFIKNMLSEIASVVYSGMTPEQVASAETRDKFYFSSFSFDLERTGKCIYWAIRGEDV